MAVSLGLHAVILYVPFLADVFSIVPLSFNEWLLVLAYSLPVILLEEASGRWRAGATAGPGARGPSVQEWPSSSVAWAPASDEPVCSATRAHRLPASSLCRCSSSSGATSSTALRRRLARQRRSSSPAVCSFNCRPFIPPFWPQAATGSGSPTFFPVRFSRYALLTLNFRSFHCVYITF